MGLHDQLLKLHGKHPVEFQGVLVSVSTSSKMMQQDSPATFQEIFLDMNKSFNYQQWEAVVISAHHTLGEDSKPRNEKYFLEKKNQKTNTSLRKKSF